MSSSQFSVLTIEHHCELGSQYDIHASANEQTGFTTTGLLTVVGNIIKCNSCGKILEPKITVLEVPTRNV